MEYPVKNVLHVTPLGDSVNILNSQTCDFNQYRNLPKTCPQSELMAILPACRKS